MASVTERLEAELAAVDGPACGWTCEHHGGNFPGCLRAKDHAGAQVLADVHVSRQQDGSLVTASDSCCGSAASDG